MESPAPLDRFDFANRIFLEALDLPAAQRESYVRRRCATDLELGNSVLHLLSRFEQLDDFLEVPAGRVPQRGLALGTVLCGRFRILEHLGGGGMGEVYRAEDQILGEVALKIVRWDLREADEVAARFREEIRLARSIAHPNVCKIFDLFTETQREEGPLEFFTMEYLAGQTLAARFAEGPVGETEGLAILAQIAEGLDAAHQKGILHRDLKPANIMLVPERAGTVRAVVTDFGLARPFERAAGGSAGTVAGQILGSLDYMAPEQFEGTHAGPPTDVFALGVIAFEMVAGTRPYPPETAVRAAVRRITEAPPTRGLSRWRPAIERALARRPEERYPSAPEFVKDLARTTLWPSLSATTRARFTRRAIWIAATATAATAVWPLARRYGMKEPPLPASPVLLLNSIAHSAIDAIESEAIELVFTRQLSQSAHLDLLGKERIAHTWHLIHGDATPLAATLDPRATREIAMRSGAQFVAFPAFIKAGDQRSLTVRLELTGSTPDKERRAWTGHFDFQRPSDLSTAAADAADWVRRTVGESEKELTGRDRSPDDVTTSDWHALEEFVRGDQAFRAGNSSQAELYLRSALEKDPKFALAAARLADILRANGRLDEALQSWAAAVTILGERDLTDRESLRIQGLFASDIGDPARAERFYARYALEYPNDPLPLFYRASVLEVLGRPEEAEQLFNLAIARDPAYQYLAGRAMLYVSLNRLDAAERDWRSAHDLEPRDYTDQIELGIAVSRGDRNRIRWTLDHLKSTGTNAGKSRAFVLEGRLLAEHGDPMGAAEQYRAGIEFDRRNGISPASELEKQRQLAEVLAAPDRSGAVQVCRNVLKRHPGASIAMQFGCILARCGETAQATAARRLATPDWPIYHYWRDRLEGELAWAQGDRRAALARFSAAAVNVPPLVWPDFLVRAAIEMKAFETAAAPLRRLVEAPGLYWIRAEQNTPGFVRVAIQFIHRVGQWPELEKKVDLLRAVIE